MNATAEQLDQFLREADPATARTVEQIVKRLLSSRSEKSKTAGEAKSPLRYHLPSRDLQARAGLDLTKLAHFDEDN